MKEKLEDEVLVRQSLGFQLVKLELVLLNPKQWAQMQAISLFWRIKGDYGILMTLDVFQEALQLAEIELSHDVFGCWECQHDGSWYIYCECSVGHPSHPVHQCTLSCGC